MESLRVPAYRLPLVEPCVLVLSCARAYAESPRDAAFTYGAPPEVTQRGFQPRSVLFIGDSHARYAYDILMDAYVGNWSEFMQAVRLDRFPPRSSSSRHSPR